MSNFFADCGFTLFHFYGQACNGQGCRRGSIVVVSRLWPLHILLGLAGPYVLGPVFSRLYGYCFSFPGLIHLACVHSTACRPLFSALVLGVIRLLGALQATHANELFRQIPAACSDRVFANDYQIYGDALTRRASSQSLLAVPTTILCGKSRAPHQHCGIVGRIMFCWHRFDVFLSPAARSEQVASCVSSLSCSRHSAASAC